jgi:glutathione reductase (NADPH)
MATQKFDVVIIGAGPGGIAAAYGLKQQGKSVAIVEENLWGGTCPNRGCDPKKILYAAVEAQERVDFLKNDGINGQLTVDWHQLMDHKRQYTQKIPTGTQSGLENADIATFYGHAHFQADETLLVDDQVVAGTDYIIATGQRPTIPAISGSQYLQTSTQFLDMDDMPKSVTFIGGGYVAFELATIANAAGADVHIIHHNQRPLKEFDQDLVHDLMDQMKENGIKFDLDIDVTTILKHDQQLEVASDGDFSIMTDAVFATTGRVPNVDTLGLEQVGVIALKKGIRVNQFLKTDNPHIYALGDVLTRVGKEPKLTPVATFEGRYLAAYLTDETHRPISYPTVPTVVYSTPKLAKIGLDPDIITGDDGKVVDLNVSQWFTYFRLGEPVAKVKVVIDKQSKTMAGAQILSSSADELINYLTQAINQRQTLEDIKQTIFAYPSVASDIQYMY